MQVGGDADGAILVGENGDGRPVTSRKGKRDLFDIV